MPKKRLPSLEKLIAQFQDHSIQQLAELYQVKENTIAKKLAEARRLNLNPNPAKEKRRQQLKKMLDEGKSFEQIGQILGLSRSAIRRFAIRNNLYTPPSNQYAYGLPIGCRQCHLMPYARGLCKNCYLRFYNRKKKNLVAHPDQLPILDHPKFKVFYTPKHGYQIYSQFFDTVHISQPTELEEILLNHLQRQILIDLDETALERLAHQEEQVKNAGPA